MKTMLELERPVPTAEVACRPLPELVGLAPIDLAELLRDLPGLALLEAARPGRRARWTVLTADPLLVLEAPSADPDPFAEARLALGRLASARPAVEDGAEPPPFAGGLVGFLGYELGSRLERLPPGPPDDQGLPVMRLALHDWVVAIDRLTGRVWLAGRAVDGDRGRLTRRLEEVRARLVDGTRSGSHDSGAAPVTDAVPTRFRDAVAIPSSRTDDPDVAHAIPTRFRSALPRAAFEARVEAVRAAIAAGEIYQANLTRRLEAPFSGDPWPLYRRLRTGDPARFAAYLDLGRGPAGRPRAIVSASPEPFLAATPDGIVASDPIKGTRPRGRTPAADRALLRELLASAKDRAENVMIVDVLRNDLGRVCLPGSIRVPRCCRPERATAVWHLVSTVTGRLAPGRDVFDLLAAAFPGGSITGAPKIRAMELLAGLENVRRGPYTGAAGWIGPDGAMVTSILIRTFVADGRRLSLHVGGGITWRSDPAAEWEETVAKAAGPLGALGAREIDGEPLEPEPLDREPLDPTRLDRELLDPAPLHRAPVDPALLAPALPGPQPPPPAPPGRGEIVDPARAGGGVRDPRPPRRRR